jgi:hypothetical protein
MADVFNVIGTYNQTSYVQGQTIVMTISGNDVLTTTTTGQAGPLTVPVVAEDGATSTITIGSVPVTLTIATNESVTIDTTRAIVDTSPTPRTWVVAANKLSISATA